MVELLVRLIAPLLRLATSWIRFKTEPEIDSYVLKWYFCFRLITFVFAIVGASLVDSVEDFVDDPMWVRLVAPFLLFSQFCSHLCSPAIYTDLNSFRSGFIKNLSQQVAEESQFFCNLCYGCLWTSGIFEILPDSQCLGILGYKQDHYWRSFVTKAPGHYSNPSQKVSSWWIHSIVSIYMPRLSAVRLDRSDLELRGCGLLLAKLQGLQTHVSLCLWKSIRRRRLSFLFVDPFAVCFTLWSDCHSNGTWYITRLHLRSCCLSCFTNGYLSLILEGLLGLAWHGCHGSVFCYSYPCDLWRPLGLPADFLPAVPNTCADKGSGIWYR